MDEEALREELADIKEALFLCQQDEQKLRTENIALKNFVQNVYESCEGLEESSLALEEVLSNLKKNIQVFAKVHQIRL